MDRIIALSGAVLALLALVASVASILDSHEQLNGFAERGTHAALWSVS
jgi:hypothetical protein